MNLSVVITTYDRQDDLVECLRSLSSQFDPPEEVIVVDDGDVDTTQQRLSNEDLESVELVSGKGTGLPAARNAGIEAATGDVVAFVDDDVILPSNWTQELRRTYERFPEAAGVGGYVLNYSPDGINKANVESFRYRLLQGIRMAFLHDKVGEVSPIGILWAPHVFMTSTIRFVDTLQGCNMSFRAEVFESTRFDEWYGSTGSSACEELDFCTRLSANGHQLIYNPRMVAVHKRSIDGLNDERSGEPNYGNMANLTYFILSHPNMGLLNLLLFVSAVSVYTAISVDTGYLGAVKDGILAYRRSESETPVQIDGGDSSGQ
ncbi:glycosyltransferase family 2 protein [Halostella sp. JP-L12]|uniref:glycosyltransferase family 2 protein n=1 Tax=Halostella TaxID=1843185 RepID=UPI000EF79F5A|nr:MULTISPECIES: glycosyltransferase [Halostella]NHN46552.1 glycosyltransferase family 2 protein [Halostella sp. JP-L12]